MVRIERLNTMEIIISHSHRQRERCPIECCRMENMKPNGFIGMMTRMFVVLCFVFDEDDDDDNSATLCTSNASARAH